VPVGRGDPVVIESGAGLIAIESDLVVVCDALSETRTEKPGVPAAVGVPLINPAGDIVRPPGKDPDARDHE
jgi:hypothetical protein